jgi:penicillin-binding protein 2
MTWFHAHEVARRAEIGRLVLVVLFGVLFLAFFRLQVLGSSGYGRQSRENRIRRVPVPAPRGLIVDRNGVVLADNVPGYTIAVVPPHPDSLPGTLERIKAIAGIDSVRITAMLRRFSRAPQERVVVLRDAPFDVVSALAEKRVAIPTLSIEMEPKRRYPYAGIAAHVVGYIGEVTEQELASGTIPGVRGGDLIGRDGLERQYDKELRGQNGVRDTEVDALGRTVTITLDIKEPEQGKTLRTFLDIELQQYIAEVFPEGARGAVVAMRPRSGEVLALYSAPSFDPNRFAGRMDRESWQELAQAEGQPLFNRAVEGRYPPASPWKLAVAVGALKRRIVTMDTRMPTPCAGGILYGNRYFRCWYEAGHGDITLREAIKHSCDVYFYQLGLQLTLTGLLEEGVELGFLEPSGIDLPDERSPVFPDSPAYFDRRYGPRGWTSGVTLNLAIGQGENSQSVINMVKFYAMLANEGGEAPLPRLVEGSETETRSLGLSPAQRAELRDALVQVVSGGTAAGARVAEFNIAGKTGTAQNAHGPAHGWFIAFAPAEAPEIVVGALVEFAEHGSDVAPLVTRIIRRYLLGPEADRRRLELVLPADSAPGALPISSDTSLTRPLQPNGQ